MNNLLLEIGSEEIPAGYIRPALTALSANLLRRLDDARIEHGDAKVCGTPRRLAIIVEDIASKQKSIKSEEGIRIDYENIDVADIMDQIKQKIAERPRSSRKEIGKEDHRYYVPSAHISADSTEIHGAKGKARGLLLKIMRPFSPLIKLLILPVYEELRETVLILDRTNKRLDYLSSSIDEVDQDLRRTMDYTRLLHTVSHNVVVELSKLKIEEENLKLKARILEKDFEHLGKREKALEKHIIR